MRTRIYNTDEDFYIRPFKQRDAVSIHVDSDTTGSRLIAILWEVEGTSAVEDYLQEVKEALKHIKKAQEIAERYNSESARIARREG